jgi:hypothetical protein
VTVGGGLVTVRAMKKLFLSIVAALLCVTVQADVIVYKNKFSVTRTGAGALTKKSLTGFTLIDTVAGTVIIYADAKRFRYSVEDLRDLTYDRDQINGPLGKEYFAIIDRNGQLGGLKTIGLNKTILAGKYFLTPQSMTVSGGDIFQLSSGTDWYNEDYKGTMVFSKSDTIFVSGKTLDEAIEAAKNTIENAGYTEEIF